MRRSSILALSLLSFGALLPAACTQDFGIFGPSGGTGGSMSTASSSTASSGGGGTGGCTADSACDDNNPCTNDTCNTATGKCVNSAAPDGPVPGFTDMVKDCQTAKCVSGAQQMVPDDNDVPDNMNPCITVACSMGTVQTTDEMQGKSCGQAPQQCDGMGNCVGCNKDSDCPDPGPCEKPSCSGEKVCEGTPEPSGTTCSANGGKVCDGAGMCVACVVDGDCTSNPTHICNNSNQCVTSCNDGVKSGKETDEDCGGPCSTKCDPGQMCNVGADCKSMVCTGSGQKTCKAAACNDNVKNGAETDVDCGGPTCGDCANGKNCLVNADCTSTHCVGNKCVDACFDTVKDGTETDVDCGGSCAAKCVNGKDCLVNGDCTSGYCNALMKCAAPACNDMAKNGTETDIDCGGSCANKCADGKDCLVNADCANGVCNASMKCAAPSCTDMAKNGDETDVDCGGSCTTKCAVGKECLVNGDCASGNCNQGQKKCQ